MRWLFELDDPVGRHDRWVLKLQQCGFDVEHRKGALHYVLDALFQGLDVHEIAAFGESTDP